MKKRKYSFKKIFIIISATFLFGLVFAYSSRLIHYYRLENFKANKGEVTTNYFNNILESTINITDSSGGLYIDDKEYIYKFNSKENYLWYSGHLWRILKINEDKTMDIVLEETLSLIHATPGENNYVSNYLEKFYENLESELLTSLNYCNDKIDDIKNITCENETDANITLLDASTYNKAGGSKSFLNNSNSYWLINTNSEGAYWYIDSDGALGIDTSLALNVRPVVRIKAEIELVDGTGIVDNPYIIKEKEVSTLAEASTGEYLTFNNSLWRIVHNNESSVTVKSLECIKENEECLEKTFGKTNIFMNSSLYKYLNDDYYKSLENKDYLVEDKFYNGTYEEHNYENLFSKEIKAFVGLPKIADYYINSDFNSYLLTPDDVEMVYTLNENGNYYLNLPTAKLNIYPVINLDNTLNILEGDGTKTNPYILSR